MKPPAASFQPLSRQEWREWLIRHHAVSAGVWLIIYKKSSGRQVLDFDAAIEAALCFGWIDSKPSKLDSERTMLWFSPRQSGSGWSKVNKERIERMIAAGLMQKPGLARIAAARLDGSWARLDAVEALEIPPDLAAAFARYPAARENFDAFPRSVKRGILEWLVQAKRDVTRARRVEETAELAARNKRANQWSR